jgi:N utilization substance protein A
MFTVKLVKKMKMWIFSDEIDSWIIDELKAIGCDTARSVLALSVDELVKRTDLEEETIKEVISILQSEFE